MSKRYELQNIRALLTEGFTDRQLRRLCYDVPDFRPVYDQLASNIGKAEIIDLLIEHSDRGELFDPLLEWAERENPKKYKKYLPYIITTSQKIQTSTNQENAVRTLAKDVMSVGNWEIQVEQIGIAERLTGVGGKTEKAAGRFAILFLAVMNNGLSNAIFIARGSLAIQDSEGKKYAENHLASAYACHQYNTNAAVKLNPDETGFMLAVFDIPKRSDNYILVPGILAKSSIGVIRLAIP